MGSYYNGSEWTQRQLRDLEKLFSKWDSDNRDAQDKSQEEVAKSQQPPAYKKPDDVQKERYRFPFVTDFLAERVQGNAGQLEALQTDGNADNGDAPQAAGKKPSKSTDESSKDDQRIFPISLISSAAFLRLLLPLLNFLPFSSQPLYSIF